MVPIGSSNRGLVTQQPKGARTGEEKMTEKLGQVVFSNSGQGTVTDTVFPSTEHHKPPGLSSAPEAGGQWEEQS